MKPAKDIPLSASMAHYNKGGVDIIDPHENVKRYVYSNVYEIGARAKPYEKIAVAKNGPYVIECVVAEGAMAQWCLQPHDEFIVCLEGEVRVDFIEPRAELAAGAHSEVPGENMGHIIVREGNLSCANTAGARTDAAPAATTVRRVTRAPIVASPMLFCTLNRAPFRSLLCAITMREATKCDLCGSLRWRSPRRPVWQRRRN